MCKIAYGTASDDCDSMVKWLYMAYIRKFKTTSGATGVQVCYKEQGKVVRTVHVGSASSTKALERLMREARGIIDGHKNPLFNLDKYNKDNLK